MYNILKMHKNKFHYKKCVTCLYCLLTTGTDVSGLEIRCDIQAITDHSNAILLFLAFSNSTLPATGRPVQPMKKPTFQSGCNMVYVTSY
jgi:hypothetical protein